MPDDGKLRNQLIGALQVLRASRTHYDSVEGQAAMDKALAAVDTYIYAAIEAERASITEDMKSAVRWAPSSAHWSERLREFFGPDAREGITALERQLREAQALARRVPLTDEQVQEVIAGIGRSVLELAKRWDDGDIHSYSLTHQAEVLAAAIVRRTEAAHGITAPKGGA